jgi:methionyl-tRNA synthetase
VIEFAEKFYITTPLFYVNDSPHIGHAYNVIAADVIARWRRLKGDRVFFLTGTDEHGEKVEQAARKHGKEPKAYADEVSAKFRETWKRLGISNDDFIRTTEPRHEKTVKSFIETVAEKGDIYKGEYEGLYCVGCETFKTETELVDGKCPDHGTKPEQRKEETYFFRLSKYGDRLLQFYEENPGFLSPAFRADEIKNRVKEGLKDLSITRLRLDWGIPFPLDGNHVVYVWFDALTNYISALDWPDGKKFGEFWPADVHLVGKEINWFHSVIWPAMLLSAGIEPPKKVFSHGWWLSDGKKMSKTLGNVIDPVKISEKYSVDALRYFLVREIPFGEDGNFVEKKFVERINGELVADLGNLVYRALSLAEKFDGKIEGPAEIEKDIDIESIAKHFDSLELHSALEETWKLVRRANRYINENEPWKLSGDRLGAVLYNLLESIRIIGILLSPFVPATSESIFAQLGVKDGNLGDCRFGRFDGAIKKGKYLFQKVEVAE